MGRAATANSASMRVRPTEDGLHLDGSILWFDSHLNGELSFLSSATSMVRTQVPQVLATEETLKILEVYHKRPNALVCQYNRPFSIGRLKMELLPSGSVLGGASLYIETDKGRLLYAPSLQTHRIPIVRQMQLKRANTLVLGAYHADPNGALPSRRREKERLLVTIKKHVEQGHYPVILCQAIATAQELTHLLASNEIPVAVHSTIHRINRVYDSSGSPLGNYGLYQPRHTRDRVLIFPALPGRGAALRRPLPDGPLLSIEETIGDSSSFGAPREADEHFYLSTTSDGRDLREVVAATDPKELFIFGPYTKRYVEEFKGLCARVRPLYPNNQPTLF